MTRHSLRILLSVTLMRLCLLNHSILLAQGEGTGAVASLTVSNKTTSSVSLTWNEPSGDRSYFTVNWAGGSVNISSNTSNTSYTVTGLTAGVNYTFTVTAVAADGQTAGAPTQISAFTNPNAVTNLTVSNKTTSSVSLTWNEPPGNRSYFTVNWTDGSVNNSSNTSNTSYTVTGLTAGVNYTFTVTAVAADGQTAGAPTQISVCTTPDVVSSLTVSNKTTSSVSLTWNGPPGNRSYFTVNWTDGSVKNSSNTSSTSYTVTGLTAGVNYTFTVTAVAADGTTGTPTQTSAFTNPNAVTNVTVSIKTTSSVSLTWNEPPGNRSYFTVNWTGGSVNNSSNTSNTSYTVTGLTAGVNYTFTVTAVAADSQTSGAPTQISAFTKPNAVTNLTVSNKTTSSVSLTWNETSGSRLYFTVNWTGGSVNNSSNTSNTSYTVTGLTAGVNYTFTVTAVAADSQTAGAPTQTSAFTKPNAVNNLTVSTINTSSLSLTWNGPPGNRSYFTVNWTGGSVNNSSNTSNTSYNVTGLTAGVNYTFTVTVVAADGTTGAPTQTSAFTNPTAVTNLTVSIKTTSSVSLTWNEPPGNRSYFTVNWTDGSVKNSSNTSNMSYTVTGLTAGVNYTFTVTAVAADSQTAGAPNQISAFTKPNAVTNLTVSIKTTSSVSLTWIEPPGNRSYFTVNWTDGSVNNSSNTSNTSYTVTGLTAGVNYTFTVTAVAADSQTAGAPTQTSAFTKPNAVTNLTVSIKTTSSVSLTWNEPPGNRSYFTVNWADGSVNNSSNTSDKSYTVTGLTAGVKYTFTVTAVAADGQTAGTPTQTSVFTNPNAVTSLTVSNKTTSSVSLTWNEPPGNRSYFTVNWTDGSVKNSSNTSNTSYTVTGLTAGVKYTFTVTAVAADGTTGAPNQTSAFTKPNAVTSLTVSNKTTSSVSLTWNEPPGNRSYFTVNWTGGSVNNSSNTSNTSYTVTGLTAGVKYTFTVTAVAADGQTAGAPNQTSTFTNPNAVTNLTGSNTTTSSVSLTWNEPPGNRSYFTVNWAGGSVNNSSNTSNTSYTVTFLTAGVNYTFTVTTVAADGQTAGAPTQTSVFTKPDTASDLSVTEITTSSLFVNWTEPIGERSIFKVQWSNDSITLNSTTSNRFFNITNLNPGVNYTILISAVAADNITEGEAVGLSVYTKPDIVRNLTISVRTTSVFLEWNKPLGESSFFRVRWTNSSTTPATDFNITDLTPGTNYTFTVSAVAADNKTEGSLVGLSTCTDASPVFDISCKGPNRTSPALLNLTWMNPPGNNQGFNISLNQTRSDFILSCSPVCNHIFSENLQYFSTYSVIISTLGCGESGTWDFKCTTGITDPSVPSNPVDVAVIVSPISQTVVKLQFNTSLLNSTNGPIKAYGVLLSTDQKSNSTRNDLTMTYSDWVKEKTKTYLTVLKLNENIISRSNMITIEIGSNNVSDVISNTGYTNGPLTNQDYRIALVLFTYLEINTGLVDIQQSILSITPFASIIAHPLEPSSNTIPIILGVLLPIIVILIIAIIVLVIQKRRTTKDYTDIPINNLSPLFSNFLICSSIPVRVEDFEAYFKKQQLDSNCGFAEQYEDLKVVGTAQTKNSALAMENKGKNRYNNVLPYDSSRVKLSIHGSPFDDYINANYISGYNSKKEYIAAQGPLPATVNEFWRMIWEKNTHSIVMLTKCYEQGRVKCEKYWPPDNKLYNNILVTTTSEIELEDWTIRDFTIKNVKTAETRNVRQFHFTAWPDHGVPETTEVLINFRHLVREHMDSFSRNAPAVVHCSAGVGRTGTLIALDHLIFQIERESIVDIYGIIHDMRMHRPLMVQTEDQYVFLNQCASDIIKSRMGTNVDLIYQNAAAFSIYENVQR
ncbi:receptor-type tyrosine-protein phosphatase eta [Ictalurus punctatus]|uniref:protein-tyrosine-phosphatase n=1 Tax=Ictalurus punctatus TaxID=7998 RepID=A0A9F7TLT1_ICTPU|nr:receptor-type tyrosine-protein phosphatase eta [Ictalurus punctatus]